MKALLLFGISLFSFLNFPISAQNVLNVSKLGSDSCTAGSKEYGKLLFNSYLANLEFISETGNIKEQEITREVNPLGDEKFTYHIVIKAEKTQKLIIKDPNSPVCNLTVDNLEPGTCQSFYIDYKLQPQSNTNTNTNTTGSLSIKTNPSGASIIINKEPQLEELTPYIITNRLPGTYKIKLKKADYNPVDTSITILPNMISEINVILKPNSIVSASDPVKILQNGINKPGRKKSFWLVSTILTAGTGGYFMYEANQKYKEYSTSSDSHATQLHKTVDLYDKLGPAFLGLAGVCTLEFTIQTIKKSKDKNRLKLYPNGQGAKLTYTF
jgi:hypothetical protein